VGRLGEVLGRSWVVLDVLGAFWSVLGEPGTRFLSKTEQN